MEKINKDMWMRLADSYQEEDHLKELYTKQIKEFLEQHHAPLELCQKISKELSSPLNNASYSYMAEIINRSLYWADTQEGWGYYWKLNILWLVFFLKQNGIRSEALFKLKSSLKLANNPLTYHEISASKAFINSLEFKLFVHKISRIIEKMQFFLEENGK